MYRYDKLTPEQRSELVRQRLFCGYPPQSPPHYAGQTCYLLTAACFRHISYMKSPTRHQEIVDLLVGQFNGNDAQVLAWVVLPNHYHLLVNIQDFPVTGRSFRSVHGSTTRRWNLEDGTVGRRVWYRYADRAIRSERHYCVTLNYIHYNPVKHGWAASPYDWAESSVRWYAEHFGREWLRDLWTRYPVRDYGRGWDWTASVDPEAR